MSRFRLAAGDDHPDAAGKHLADAQVLCNGGRADGAAYLAGYVVECSLKSLLLAEKGLPTLGSSLPWKKGREGHDLGRLQSDAATLVFSSSARTARYFGTAVQGLASSALATWVPEMRYRGPSVGLPDAKQWVAVADAVYLETVAAMIKDGVV